MAVVQTHLFRRGAIYRLRRRLPNPLNTLLRRSHYDCSLRTADPAVARRRARRLSAAIDTLAETIADMPPARQPSPGQINLVLKRLFDDILAEGQERRERTLQDGPPSLPSGNRQRILDGTADDDDRAALETALALGEFEELPEHTASRWGALAEGGIVNQEVQSLVDRTLKRQKLAVDSASEAYRRLCLDASRVATKAYQVECDRYDGNYDDDQVPPGWIDRTYPLVTPAVRTWLGQFNSEEVDFLARPISDVAREFMGKKRGSHVAKTTRDQALACRYFVSLIGDLRMGDITDKEGERFRERLLDVPNGYGKGIFGRIEPREAVARLKALKEAIEAADKAGEDVVRFLGREWGIEEAQEKTERMSMKTANKHLTFFTTLWRSRVVPKALRPMCPFAGTLYTETERDQDDPGEARVPFTTDELNRLFSSPVWTGCQSTARRSKPGSLVLPDARMMAPLIAAFTGMRREEICQLKGSDFDTRDGIWFIRVEGTEGRRLKKKTSRREVPVHSELVKLGLREYVAYRGSEYLFPDLAPSAANASRGDPLGKWFSRYRREIGVGREEVDFHAFRTTFIQALRDAGVSLDKIKPITGHLEKDVTIVNYGRSFSLKQRRAVVEKLKLGIDLAHLHGRMPELLPLLDKFEKPRSVRKRRLVPRKGT